MEKWAASKLYFDSVIPFSKILEEMEYHGFKIDRKRMVEVDEEFTERIEECSKNIYRIAGKTFNIRSTPQLSTVLYKDLKIPNYVEDYMPDKDGKWVLVKDEFLTDKQEEDRKKGIEVVGTSTDVFAIKKIQQVYDHPIVNELLEFKKLAKLKSTYIDGLKKLIAPDGKVHPSFFQLSFGARPICDSPNLLQIPSRTDDGRKIKELFIVDSDEYDLVSMDFSAMELRFLAWLANDRVMFKAFMDDIDVHSLMCSNIKQFGLTYEQAREKKNKNKRFCAKTTNFLMVYGGGFSELQNQLLKQGDLYIPKKECAEFMETFYKTFPDIRPLQERVFDFVDRKGYISNIFGRKRYFKNLLDKPDANNREEVKAYNSMKSSAHRSAFSHFISSSSSGDYSAYKSALLKQLIVKNKFDAHFVNMLYDAIYIQVHKSQTEEFVPMMQELMSRADSPVEIRLPVEIGIGKNWGEV